MGTLIMSLQLILSLSILVTLHELGHYLAARAFGIRVDKFFVFFDAFGIKLFKIKKGDTEYGIGWLPLGGYCKIAGMIDESMDREQLKKAPEPWEFRSKPAWQRFIVMIAGVVMNLILGVFIFSFNMWYFEQSYIPIEEVNKEGIYATHIAQEVGFKNGDKILKINEQNIKRWNDAVGINVFMGCDITIERNGQQQIIKVPDTLYKTIQKSREGLFEISQSPITIDTLVPNGNALKGGLQKGDQIVSINHIPTKSFNAIIRILPQFKGQTVQVGFIRNQQQQQLDIDVDSTGRIGFTTYMKRYKRHSYSIGEAFNFGTKDAFKFLFTNIKGFGNIINGRDNASEAIQGPIGMAKMFGSMWNWRRFWTLTGFISMILAFMNILPIPALDGGHAMFTIYEMISGRKPSDKFLEYAQVFGMLILFSLMIFVFGNDIFKLLSMIALT